VRVGHALRAGPESAGASPGPVCNGLAARADHHRCQSDVGRLGATVSSAQMPLNLDAKKSPTENCNPSASTDRTPEGLGRIANTKMRMCALVTTERGSTLLIRTGRYGADAAPLRGARIVIGTVIIPRRRVHFSACVMLVAYLRPFCQQWFTPLDDARFRQWKTFPKMERAGRDTVDVAVAPGARCGAPRHALVGQEQPSPSSFQLSCSPRKIGRIKTRFDAVHQIDMLFGPAEKPNRDLRAAIIADRKPVRTYRQREVS